MVSSSRESILSTGDQTLEIDLKIKKKWPTWLEGLYLAHLQFIYLTRSPCRVREGFFDALCNNIQKIGLPDKHEVSLLALAILAFKKRPSIRKIYINQALDKIHAIARLNIRLLRQLGMEHDGVIPALMISVQGRPNVGD